MACGSGCCATPKALPAVLRAPTPELVPVEEGGSAIDCEDDCCQPQPKAGANGSDAGSAKDASMEDGCCSSRPVNVEPQNLKRPSCCEGKSSPCCDSSCIERLALRECATESTLDIKTGDAPADCARGNSKTPCQHHIRSTWNRYRSRLEVLGCICSALLALGQESCCVPPRRSSLQKTHSSSRASVASCASADSCCAPKKSTCGSIAKPRPRSSKGSSTAKAASCADACCNTKTPKETSVSSCADACCDDEISSKSCADACCDEIIPEKAPASSCADACCSPKNRVTQTTREIKIDPSRTVDLETGLSGKEHVILTISGMTCTGCETKLSRTLATLPAITKLKTSLVLSRAEFDLDVGTISADAVMKHLERTTEFKCERITNQGSSIDLICQGDPIDAVKGDWPSGVTEVKMVDRKIIRVDFDAKVVGARDLVEKGWPASMPLAPLRADSNLEAGSRHVRHVGYMTLLSIVLTIPVLVLSWAPLPDKKSKEITYGSISLAFATIIQFVVAGPFYPKALKALVFSRVIEMDLLIVLSTSAAYIFSIVAYGHMVAHKPLSTGEFFETSTLLVTLIMVGRYVAALARQKAVESISIRSLQSSTATIVDQDEEKEIDSRLLQYGDVFRVFPESKVPTDGTVLSGSSEIDESMITGESRPVEKFKGSPVIAGSINGSGALTVRLTRIPGDNTISTIASMVDEAKLSKPKIQEIADQVATYFVPVVISLTIVVFCIWVAVGVAIQNKSGSEATIQAITYAITVLVVSCPCAIGLAVPMVIVIATGVAAERGVIFKSADAIEVAYKTAHVVFDKTGTLTQGKLTVAREQYPNASPSTKSMLLGLIGSSKHPVSVAVANLLKTSNVNATTLSDPKSVVGKGVEANFAGRTLRAGNSRWLNLSDDPHVASVLSEGYTAFCFTVNGSLAAVFGLEDSLREDTLPTITKLQQDGISVHILSGDDDGAVRAIASQLNICDTNVRSRCSPADKQTYIKDLLATRGPGKKAKEPIVMFCGDGTNDAIALAQATIGVHMHEGTDVAASAADIVLMRPSLSGILIAISVSRKSIHRIAFNFGWSFVYNLFAILLASGAFVHARIPPEFAGLGELVSVLPVVAAGMLLKWAKL
ncbi:copper-translocating P-t [Ophiobolus disseminans]|uniref:Copper-translocating P-t n=1 Tax=Ophiobolus disseminans TaxID=1469910 RepID=A0A6A7A5H6_9PLEO|nr:copper-translocating P-t [Ophiobolus disseminans]